MNLKVDVIESEEGPGYGRSDACSRWMWRIRQRTGSSRSACESCDTVEPDDKLVTKYEAKYQQFREIYPALKGVFQKLMINYKDFNKF